MDWSIHYTVMVSALAAGGAVGFVAAKSHFCTMGAVSDWVNMGDLSRLRGWFLAIAVAILGTIAVEASQGVNLNEGTFPPYRSSQLVWLRHILGGFLFGIGMTLASGCGNKTVVRIGGGNLKSLVVLVVMGAVAYWLTWGGGYAFLFEPWLSRTAISLAGPQELARTLFGTTSPVAHYAVGAVVAAALLIFAFLSPDFRSNRDLVVASIVIGLAVAFVWWLTGSATTGTSWREYAEFADQPLSRVNTQSLTFVAPVADLLYYLQAPGEVNRLNIGIMTVIGVLVGSLLYALISSTFRLEWFANSSDLINHLIGAVLMGVGGILSMGCTFGQGITGMSTLAVGSFLSLISIIAGSAAMLKYLYWKMMNED